MYILIVMGWLAGAAQGSFVNMQEFSTKERCEDVKNEILAQVQAWKDDTAYIKPFCVPK
jgi:hypothetical protein